MRIIGNGGHASVVREVYAAMQAHPDFRWIYDDCIFIAVGDNAVRKREAEAIAVPMLARIPNPFATLIHPSAVVSSSATIGEGSVIMAGAVVQAGAEIGKHCILNSGCVVDHHCILRDYVHIAPGAHLCGGVEVGEGALVAVCVGVAPNTKIAAWSLVKARKIEIWYPAPTA